MNADDRVGSRNLVSAVHLEHGEVVTNLEFSVVEPVLTDFETDMIITATDGFHYTLVECLRLTQATGFDFIGPLGSIIEEYRKGLLEKATKTKKV